MTAAIPSTVPAAEFLADFEFAPRAGGEGSGEFPAVWFETLLASEAWTGSGAGRSEPHPEWPQAAKQSVEEDSGSSDGGGTGHGVPERPGIGETPRVPEDLGFGALASLTLLLFQPVPALPRSESGSGIEAAPESRAGAFLLATAPAPTPPPAAGDPLERVLKGVSTSPESGAASQLLVLEPSLFRPAADTASKEKGVDLGSAADLPREAVPGPPDRERSEDAPPDPPENRAAFSETAEPRFAAARPDPRAHSAAFDQERPGAAAGEEIPRGHDESPAPIAQPKPAIAPERGEQAEGEPTRKDAIEQADAESSPSNPWRPPAAPGSASEPAADVAHPVPIEVRPAVERQTAAELVKTSPGAAAGHPGTPVFAERRPPHESSSPHPFAREAPVPENSPRPLAVPDAAGTARPEGDPVVALRIRIDPGRVPAPVPETPERDNSMADQGETAERVDTAPRNVSSPLEPRSHLSSVDRDTAAETKKPIGYAGPFVRGRPRQDGDAPAQPAIGRESLESAASAPRGTSRETGMAGRAETGRESQETEFPKPVLGAHSPAPVGERSPGSPPTAFVAENVRLDSPGTGPAGAKPTAMQPSPGESAVAVSGTAAQPAAPPPPLREMRLELKSESNQTVELRIGGRGDDVRVELRTQDPGLAETFREDLPRLVESMERHGLSVDTGAPAAATGEARPGRASETFEGGTGDESRKGQGSSDMQGQHQRRRRDGGEAEFEEIREQVARQGGMPK